MKNSLRRGKKRPGSLAVRSSFLWRRSGLGLGAFLDGKLAAVVTALGANVMEHNLCAAVAASGQLGFLQTVMSSSLGSSRL